METLKYLDKVGDEYIIKEEQLKKFQELKAQADKSAKELKEFSQDLYGELKQVFTDTTKVSNYNFIVKGGYYTFDFDLELFKKEHLELYIAYLKPKATSVSYSFQKASRKGE